MDPLTAISLAGNVFQFVSFAGTLLSGACRLYKSEKGSTEANQELEDLTKTLRDHVHDISGDHFGDWIDPAASTDSTKGSIRELCAQCEIVADRLLVALESVKLKNNRTAWHTVSQALLTIWKKNEIEELQRRLDSIRDSLGLILATRNQKEIENQIKDLAVSNRRLHANRSKEIDRLKSDFNSLFTQLRREEQTNSSKAWFQIGSSAVKGKGYSVEQTILRMLHFGALNYRQDAILQEHAETFQWIFHPSQHPQNGPQVNFLEWLTSNESLYWVSGKPGSGKSTLMKFLTKHYRVKSLLGHWAGDDRLIIISFFFWNAAYDSLQKSSVGLMRSILFQILRECPELISDAFPDEWHTLSGKADLESASLRSSSLEELLAAFHRIINLLPDQQVKFCFFIDGLDEYEGEPGEIIKLVDMLHQSNNLKACVSSRPWNEFEAIFGNVNPWKIYIHELTKHDIERYVKHTLGKDSRFIELRNTDERCPDLVREIVEAAQGVFLWVSLVVRSLSEGLTNADRIVDLQNRLHEMPQDLEKYFEKMLFDVDDRYRQQMAHTFRVTLDAQSSIPLLAHWYIDEDDLRSMFKMSVEPIPRKRVLARLEQMKRRINARSKGLLQTQPLALGSTNTELSWDSYYLNSVDFLHRTARDFLQTPDMQGLLREWSADQFDSAFQICQAMVAMIKSSPRGLEYFEPTGQAYTFLQSFFAHAALLEKKEKLDRLRFSLIDEMISCLKTHSKVLNDNKHSVLPSAAEDKLFNLKFDDAALYECVRADLKRYVEAKFDDERLASFEDPSRLLNACIPSSEPFLRRKVNLEMLELLLNRRLGSSSAWRSFLHKIGTSGPRSPLVHNDILDSWFDCASLLLKHGADPEAVVECTYFEEVFPVAKRPHNWAHKPPQVPAKELLRRVFNQEQFLALEARTWHPIPTPDPEVLLKKNEKISKLDTIKGVRMNPFRKK